MFPSAIKTIMLVAEGKPVNSNESGRKTSSEIVRLNGELKAGVA